MSSSNPERGEFWHLPAEGPAKYTGAQKPLTRKELGTLRVIPAVPTIFQKHGLGPEDAPINFDAMATLINWLIEQGVDALVIGGTTAEAATLTHDEQIALIGWAVTFVNGRVPIIAGVGSNCTRESITLAQGALRVGAAAGLLVMPYYNKPNPTGQLAHFRTVADVGLPIILYTVKGRTGREIAAEVVRDLANDDARFLGIKVADGAINRFELLNSLTPNDFVILSGDDDLTLAAARQGWCTGTITVVGMLAVSPLKDSLNDRITHARLPSEVAAQESWFAGLAGIVFSDTNPIPIKTILATKLDLPLGFRLPLTPLSNEASQALLQRLEALGSYPNPS